MRDIDLQIEGVTDRRVADAIRRGVRKAWRQFAADGEWRVTVWPSDTRGEWDIGIRTPSKWHLESFRAAAEDLPAFVEQKLQEYLQLTSAPS